MKPRLIIVSPTQYGYQTDYLKYVQYLPEKYDVVFICVDKGKHRFNCSNAEIKYIKFGSSITTAIAYTVFVYFYIIFHSGKILSANFKGCRFLKKAIFWRKMIVNIRTVSVDRDASAQLKRNIRIRKDALPFDRIIMISKGGAQQLNLPMEKVDIVGLGADVISDVPKSYDKLNLLYVGTMDNRNILQTVIGFHKYLDDTHDNTATYDIIGDGEELQSIKDYVASNNLSRRVFIHGRKRYDELKPYFDKCNIGVSFVPITEAYRFQPPTKTFEYINSGLFTIATRNQIHEETVHPDSGLLIADTSDAFCDALKKTTTLSIDEYKVRKGGMPFLWRTIVKNELMASINKV